MMNYDPSRKFEFKTFDLEYRRNPIRALMARVYQPEGAGPFPVLVDVHAGAWNGQDRTANQLMDKGLAEGGILVVAIDVLWASEAPIRGRCRTFTSASVGEGALRGMEWRPSDGRPPRRFERRARVRADCDAAVRPPVQRPQAREGPDLDATVPFAVVRSPISDRTPATSRRIACSASS
jgi:hypothetical protein